MQEILLREEHHIAVAREMAKSTAQDMGFSASAIGQIALAVSEICQNVIRYALEGVVRISTRNHRKVLQITVQDKGPGIPDITQYMQDGYTTTTSSIGVGLMAAKRSVDLFDIQSDSRGTTVVLEKHLPISKEIFEYGVVSVPDQNYVVNGDAFVVKSFDGDKVLIAVIDGLGQGATAHQMAKAVQKIVENNFFLPLEQIVLHCHQFLKDSSFEEGGIAMSIALLTPTHIHYLGVGDTHGFLLNDSPHFFLNIDGRVGGHLLRSLVVRSYATTTEQYIVLCTDGIQSRLEMSGINWEQRLQRTATQLFNEYNRLYGDATILVAKYTVPSKYKKEVHEV